MLPWLCSCNKRSCDGMSETVPERPVPADLLDGLFLSRLSDLTRNTLPDGFPEDWTFEEALFAWAGKHLPEDRQDLFRSLFSAEQLRSSFADGKTGCSFDYDDPEDPALSRRLIMHFLTDEDTGDLLCVSSLKSFPRAAEAAASGDASPFRAVIRSYPLFFCVDLNAPRIFSASVFRDEDGVSASVSLPCSYADFIKSVSARYVRAAWEDEFLSLVALDHLKEQAAAGRTVSGHTFSSDAGTRRLDIFLPDPASEDQRCFLGVSSAVSQEDSGLTVTTQDVIAMNAAMEDLRLEMQMERKETKKKHRRRTTLLALFTVIAGIVGGAVLALHVPEVSDVVTRFFPLPVEEEPTPTPPPAVQTEVKEQETVTVYVAPVESFEFEAEIQENGLPRVSAASENYETIPFTVSVSELLGPEWFAENYAKEGLYLDGTEACAHLTVSFPSAEDREIDSINPQETFPLKVVDSKGTPLNAYQLMDQPSGGAYAVPVEADTPADLYKRYDYSEDARYLVLTAYREDVRYEYCFALRYDDPNVDWPEQKQGVRSEVVRAMKQKLIALGYLKDGAARSDLFDMDTVNAVRNAQKAFELDPTGIADTAFLKKLFSE